MVRRFLAVWAVCLVGGSVLAQGPPPGGVKYFGAPAGDKFAPDALFPAPPAPPAPPPVADPLLPPPPPKIWAGGIDLGVNGTSGNSDLVNFRAGINAKRQTADNIFVTDFLYTYARQEGLTTANQALFNARDEILFPDSPWSLFGATQFEYDQLRAYRYRVGVYAGAGYTVRDDEDMTFKLRGGAGAVREFGTGANEDRWVPEFVFGYDFRYRLSDRSSFLSILDYYPRIDDPSQFRVRARAAYEHVLDPATATVLRLGVQDRYDSHPGNAEKNDLTYFVSLGVRF
jgi:hypothetical protein